MLILISGHSFCCACWAFWCFKNSWWNIGRAQFLIPRCWGGFTPNLNWLIWPIECAWLWFCWLVYLPVNILVSHSGSMNSYLPMLRPCISFYKSCDANNYMRNRYRKIMPIRILFIRLASAFWKRVEDDFFQFCGLDWNVLFAIISAMLLSVWVFMLHVMWL